MKYVLQDLIDIKRFQNLLDRLNEIYFFPSAILDNKGNVLAETGWQEICTKFHRKNKEAVKACKKNESYIRTHIHEANPALSYRCPHGPVNTAMPILIDGVHYGTFITGQFFLKAPDMAFFRDQAEKYGFDEAAYLQSIEKVPVRTEKQLNNYLVFIKRLIRIITKSGLQKLKEIETYNQILRKEKRYQSILKTAMDGYWVTDSKGRLLEVNDAYCRMSGYTEAELLDMSITDLEAVETPELIAIHLQKVISNGSDRFESRHRRKDGSIFDVDVNIQFRRDEDGQAVCFIRNITEQKKTFEAIKTSNEKMKLAAESAHFGIWELDVRKNRLEWDEWMFRLYGVDPKDFNKTYEAWQKGVHPQDLDRSNREVEQALSGEKQFDTQFRIIRPDGTRKHIKAHATVLRNSAGDPTHMIGINYDITGQKKAALALEESEARFRTAFMTSPDAININRLKDGMYIDINEGFTQIMGYSRDDVIGKESTALNIWKNPEDREKLAAGLTARGFVDNLEAQFVGKDSQVRYGLMSARKITLNNEDVILSVTRDITKRKEVENALKASEKKWRNILINTPQIGISLNPEAQITFANQRFLILTGWKEHEILGQNWFNMFIPENVRETVRKVFRSVMGQKDKTGFSTYENEIVGKSGEIFNIAWSNVLTKDAQGKIVDVTCLGVDLTERRRNEDRLKKSEIKYRTMMEAIKDPVYICSQDYKILYINQAMRDRIGYNAVMDPCYKALHGFEKKCSWCEYSEISENGHIERNIISPMDKRSFSVSSTFFKNEDGKSSKLSVFRDTTELLNLQNRLQQAQKMEAIGNLAGGIAHDFNNILFPIIGMSELMMDDLPCDHISYEHAHEINKAGLRAKELVSQILSFSRQSEQEIMPVRFQIILKEVLKLCRATIPANIEIVQDIQKKCGSVRANATQLHQIAMNLITNAYHAVENKNGKITITLKEILLDHGNIGNLAVHPGKHLVFSVCDNGTGIPPEIKHHLFEPYFTTKKRGKGTGLGLAVVYGIVKKGNGDIKIDSEVEKGTTFSVFLPVIERPGKDPFANDRPETEKGHEHVLLVDDDNSVIKLEKQMLERLGYSVTSRLSSNEALEAFKANPNAFDIVLTDMTMPNMTGDQLAGEIKKIKPDIPIIVCTGFSERINRERAESIGINGFLMKPIMKMEMARMIRQVLDK